jgi:hypothetical protein
LVIVDCAGADAAVFASPKSRIFTTPAGVIWMFAGLRSRWMMSFSCAAFNAPAVCLAMSTASLIGIGPLRRRSSSVCPFDQFEHQRIHAGLLFHAVDGRDVRMIDCGEGTGLTLESREAIWIRLKGCGKDLDRHFAPEFQVARSINLPHPASTQDADHLEPTDAGARRQRHVAGSECLAIAVIAELDSATGSVGDNSVTQ